MANLPPMKCPDCSTSQVAQGAVGPFCPRCGHPVASPGKRPSVLPLAGGAILFAALVAAAVFFVARSFVRDGIRSISNEARANLPRIAEAEMAHFETHGAFVAAGPVPGQVASCFYSACKRESFHPDEGFRAIGFAPVDSHVWYQYEVRLVGTDRAVVTARGDIDGNGKHSEFRLALGPGRATGQVEEEDPLE